MRNKNGDLVNCSLILVSFYWCW